MIAGHCILARKLVIGTRGIDRFARHPLCVHPLGVDLRGDWGVAVAGGSAVGGCGVQRTLGARRHGPSRLGRRQRRRARHPLRTCADDALASLIEPAQQTPHSECERRRQSSGKVTCQTHRPGECSWSVSVNDAFQTREEGFAARAKEGTEGRKGADPPGSAFTCASSVSGAAPLARHRHRRCPSPLRPACTSSGSGRKSTPIVNAGRGTGTRSLTWIRKRWQNQQFQSQQGLGSAHA